MSNTYPNVSHKTGCESAGRIDMNGGLKENSPHKPVGSEQRKSMRHIRLNRKFHIKTTRRQPFEQENHEGSRLDCNNAYQHPALDMQKIVTSQRFRDFFWIFQRKQLYKERSLTDVSNGSKNAVGEIIPVRLFTTIAIPVSINGSLKSTTASRSALIINDVKTISTFRLTRSAINPFHLPFSSVPHLPSSTRTNSYVKPIESTPMKK